MKSIRIFLIAAFFIKAGDITAQTPVPDSLLPAYYRLSEALVRGSVSETASAAGVLGRFLNLVDYKTISEGNLGTLLKDVSAITATEKLEVQRNRFENLSANFVLLAKTVHLTHDPVFIIYCPMKKAYWLSGVPEVRNPYYGHSMLNCGSVTDSLKH